MLTISRLCFRLKMMVFCWGGGLLGLAAGLGVRVRVWNYGSSFQFQMNKKEIEIREFKMHLKF